MKRSEKWNIDSMNYSRSISILDITPTSPNERAATIFVCRVSGIRVLREVIQVQKKTSPVLQGLDENGTAVEIEIVSSMLLSSFKGVEVGLGIELGWVSLQRTF
ncbi:hypothetical protein CK203_034484 [Vitis vinifera]|uniref:Uncharacterized protein n=1 Tax=Vitis vinifera TaxID=29760 RepID=A0A438HZD3_VITVI|nr:hypothetical protein CK203_034484 [Vitis vinifera]